MSAPPALSQPDRRMDALVANGEFPITAKDFDVISGIMMAQTGISLPIAKANLVYSRVAKRLRQLGLRDFKEYCALVTSADGAAECQEMIASLTTNVTRFFREPHHFEHLKTKILPDLVAAARTGGRIRLWSAACSSGQEPYSMALTLLSVMPDAAKYDVKILATDIDPNMLKAGAEGIYDEAALEPVPASLRERWFRALNDGTGRRQAVDEMRKLVSFKKLNLIGSWPIRNKFHAVFCRNVAIYFENDTQEMIWSRFFPLLEDQAALYIGHSERVSGLAEALLRSDGITIYRPNGAKGARA
ncbi:MAG: protein-glutamate O-methyltransferase [Acidocella sp.]|nr:protein-glutamate O-methyltransferase [Acidocella sp.]